MFFLLRLGFWFALVLFLLPLGAGSNQDAENVSPLEAVWAAQQAIHDVSTMCDRQPGVCVTGKAALRTIGSRASDTARGFAQTLDGALDDGDAEQGNAIPLPTPRPSAKVESGNQADH